ncbi:hypothetical protein LCGC14_1437550, partial [marine sediment metagenome]
RIRFQADDGSDYNTNAAEISAEVDGTPGVNDVPGRLLFSTTPDGSSSVIERMRITNTGNVGIGDDSPDFLLDIEGDIGIDGTISILEQVDANADLAGRGQVWVDNLAPNILMFTDDVGTDFTVVMQAYVTIEDEDGALAQESILNFAGAGVICADDGAQTTCTIAGGAGGEDLQGTYDLETAPALIVVTDALGGIQLNGDAETTEATLTILDDVDGQVGVLLDNDDEVGAEASPILRFVNSTAGAGDTQFDLVVTGSDEFEIRGDDGAADVTIASAGAVTLASTLTVTSSILTPAADLVLNPGGTSRINLVGELEETTTAGLEIGASADVRIYIDANNNSNNSFFIHDNSDFSSVSGVVLTYNPQGNTWTWASATDVSGVGDLTATGVVTIDGASASLEIPNTAGGRTVDAAGEVTVDTTSETVNFHDGTEERVLTPRFSKSLLLENPIATDDLTLWRVEETSTSSGITLLEICYLSKGGTNWIGQIQEQSSNGGSGANVHASDITAAAGASNCTTSFSNASIDSTDWVGIKTTSVSGGPTSLHVTVYYDIDP